MSVPFFPETFLLVGCFITSAVFFFISFILFLFFRDEFGCRIVGEPLACDDDGSHDGRESSRVWWTRELSVRPSRHTEKNGVLPWFVSRVCLCVSVCVCVLCSCHSDDRMDVFLIFNSFYFFFFLLLGFFFVPPIIPERIKWQNLNSFNFTRASFQNRFLGGDFTFAPIRLRYIATHARHSFTNKEIKKKKNVLTCCFFVCFFYLRPFVVV